MPICPRCGSKRVDRYCAACGTVVAPLATAAAPPARSPVRPVAPSGGGKGLVIFCFILAGAIGTMFFRSQPTVRPPLLAPTPSQDFYGSRSLHQLEEDVESRLAAGRAGVQTLELRIVALRSDLDRWATERDEALSARQRMLQSLRQADYEGRWPTKAAGRYVDRAGLQEMIRRTDQWMQQYASVSVAAEARVSKISIAAGLADKLLLAMERIEQDIRDRGPAAVQQSYLQAQHSNLQQLGVQLDLILRDPALTAGGLQLAPLGIERS